MLILALGLIGIGGFLFADAFIFTALDSATVQALIGGSTGRAIFASVILYVLGVVLFGIATIRAGVYPWPAAALYILGTLPTPAAMALPPIAISISESIASAGVIWLAVTLYRAAGQPEVAR